MHVGIGLVSRLGYVTVTTSNVLGVDMETLIFGLTLRPIVRVILVEDVTVSRWIAFGIP